MASEQAAREKEARDKAESEKVLFNPLNPSVFHPPDDLSPSPLTQLLGGSPIIPTLILARTPTLTLANPRLQPRTAGT